MKLAKLHVGDLIKAQRTEIDTAAAAAKINGPDRGFLNNAILQAKPSTPADLTELLKDPKALVTAYTLQQARKSMDPKNLDELKPLSHYGINLEDKVLAARIRVSDPTRTVLLRLDTSVVRVPHAIGDPLLAGALSKIDETTLRTQSIADVEEPTPSAKYIADIQHIHGGFDSWTVLARRDAFEEHAVGAVAFSFSYDPGAGTQIYSEPNGPGAQEMRTRVAQVFGKENGQLEMPLPMMVIATLESQDPKVEALVGELNHNYGYQFDLAEIKTNLAAQPWPSQTPSIE